MSDTIVHEQSDKWKQTIAPLVARTGLTADEVTDTLVGVRRLVSAANDAGAEAIADAEVLGNEDFLAAFSSVPRGNLLLALKEMRQVGKAPAAASTVAPVAAAPAFPAMPTNPLFIIPDVEDGANFLTALSTSRGLTVDQVTIRAALEALAADNLELSEIPEQLATLMENYADEIEEPVGDSFLEVHKLVRERRYAEMAIDSRFVTKARKAEVLKRLQALPAAALEFQTVLASWYDQLRQIRSTNPLGILQVGGIQYPPTDEPIAASEILVACLRKAFAGYGVMVTKALAYEGLKVREILDNPQLPALTGSPNREIMLRKLGIDVTNADVRLERAVARYVLFVASTVPKNLPAGQEGPVLESLFTLGQTIMSWLSPAGGSNGDKKTVVPRYFGGRVESYPGQPHPIGTTRG